MEDAYMFEWLADKRIVGMLIYQHIDPAIKLSNVKLIKTLRRLQYTNHNSVQHAENIWQRIQNEKAIMQFESIVGFMKNSFEKEKHPIEQLLYEHYKYSGGSWDSPLKPETLTIVSKLFSNNS